jgi:hypothetical protein
MMNERNYSFQERFLNKLCLGWSGLLLIVLFTVNSLYTGKYLSTHHLLYLEIAMQLL